MTIVISKRVIFGGGVKHAVSYMRFIFSLSFPLLVLGLAFVPLHDSGFEKPPYFYFNMYTGPGFLSAILAFINLILVIFLFKERRLVKKADFKKMKAVDRSHHGI